MSLTSESRDRSDLAIRNWGIFFIIIKYIPIKVAAEFETKGNGQNEIVSHMNRSEVKF